MSQFFHLDNYEHKYRIFVSNLVLKVEAEFESNLVDGNLELTLNGKFKFGFKKSSVNINTLLSLENYKILSHSIICSGINHSEIYKITQSLDFIEYTKNNLKSSALLPTQGVCEPLFLLLFCLENNEYEEVPERLIVGGKTRFLKLNSGLEFLEIMINDRKLKLFKTENKTFFELPVIKSKLYVEKTI